MYIQHKYTILYVCVILSFYRGKPMNNFDDHDKLQKSYVPINIHNAHRNKTIAYVSYDCWCMFVYQKRTICVVFIINPLNDFKHVKGNMNKKGTKVVSNVLEFPNKT